MKIRDISATSVQNPLNSGTAITVLVPAHSAAQNKTQGFRKSLPQTQLHKRSM